MRSTRLTILATLSLVLLAGLLCGYFIDADLGLMRISPSGGGGIMRFCGIASQRGGMGVAWGTFKSPSSAPSSTTYHLGSNRWNIGLPRAVPSLLGFRVENRNAPTRQTITLACPNWLLILPCTIAPLLWWRRRRAAALRGFAVEPRERANPIPASET